MASSQFSFEAQRDLNHVLKTDQEKNSVNVYEFDPASSPRQKAAAAAKGSHQLESISQANSDKSGAREITLDSAKGESKILPTITISDADKERGSQSHNTLAIANENTFVPGALPTALASTIPAWFKVGWRTVGGVDNPPVEGEQKDRSVLDMYLNEQFYGSWYHNAAVIFFAVFSAHFLTLFGLGLGWHFIVLAICSTYYSASVRRVRRRARDDIQRELVKTRLMSEHETADWINNFLDRFWLIYEPVLSATIVSSVDQILSTSTPAFLDSIRLSTFTLGTKAPRIDKVRTFPRTPDDIVMMDWGLSFTPSDLSDVSPLEAQKRVNPKIVLSIRVGKGVATAAIPILLEDINFTGHLRIRLKLMTNFPHIQVVDISFLEKPVFDYVLKPIGGDTFGFDVGNIPGLSSFIRDMVHTNLGPMMYDPNVFTLNLEQMLSGTPTDAAIGVLRIHIQSARGLKGMKIGGGSPDPYVSLSIGGRSEISRTAVRHNTFNPIWGETRFLLINSLTESLSLTIFDYNDHRKDYEIGSATFDMSKLQEDANQEDVEVKALKDGKDRGDIKFDLSFFPVLKPSKTNGKEEGLPDTKIGIVRLTIHQAKDLDHSKSLSGDLNPFAKLLLGDKVIHTTSRVKHTNNPVWESSVEFLCSDKATSIIAVQIVDDRDFMKDPIVGYLSIKLQDLLDASHETDRDWWSLSRCKSGRVRITTEWKPLNMAGALHGADEYVPSIGIIRLWLQRASDLKNVEAALGGKSDPYIRVLINNVTMGRTEVVNNNLNPEWDQIIYIPVHSLKESMVLECMDYQHLTKDRSLGFVELKVSDLAVQAEDVKYPYASNGKKIMAEPIHLDKGNVYKGTLHCVAEFVPCIALKNVGFQSAVDELGESADGDKRSKQPSGFDHNGLISEGVKLTNGADAHPNFTESRQDGKDKDSSESRKSVDSIEATRSTKTPSLAETAPETTVSPGVELSKEELLRHQSGVVVFNIRSGRLSQKSRLEVLLDDGYWPAFSTVKARSVHAQWDHVGEGFIKEVDFGRIWLRLNTNDEGTKDDIIAEFKCDSRSFLDEAMDGPKMYTLTDIDGHHSSTVEIEARYIPVDIVLEPRESINNQGVIRVDLLSGSQLHGIDRGGKSDPFVVFTLNGTKVFKSQTKKRTLSPEWNENFLISVPSRVAANFSLEVFDWNQIENAKSLGSARVDLADLEPFQRVERHAILSSDKYGDSGQILLALLFTPEIIAKTRKNTSTFSSAGRAMTQIGSLPVGAGKGVIHGVGSVGRGVHGIFAKDHARRSLEDPTKDGVIETSEAGQYFAPPSVSNENSALFPSKESLTGSVPVPTAGTLRVVVLGAKDILAAGGNDSIKPYVVLKVGDKEQKTRHIGKSITFEWNESFIFFANANTPKLYVAVFDHKTLGKDRLLWEGNVDIWRHIHNGVAAADVTADLNEGQGILRLRLEFDAGSPPSSVGMSSIMGERGALGSPSRFSLTGRK